MQTSHGSSSSAKNVAPSFADGRRVYPFVIFAVVMSTVTMSAIDQSIVATALPTLRKDLHAPLSWAAWTITGYQFGLVMALPVAGRISDQFGRRRIFLTCLVIFTVSSLLCATATNVYELVVFRVIQAVGGGAFTPSAVGIITDHFGENRDRAVGMSTSTVPIGAIAGPVIGGVIIAYWSWRGVFLINVPIGILVFVLTLRFVPKSRPMDAPKADVHGIALLAGFVLPLMYGITTLGGNRTAIWSPSFVIPEVFALGFGYLFVRHAKVAEAPILPLRLIHKGGFGKLNIINFLYGGCALGVTVLIPLYVETRYGFKSLEAGTVLSSRAVGQLVVGGTTAFLIRRVGYRRPMIVGFLFASAGMALLSFGPRVISTYSWIAVGATIMGIGAGIAAPASNNAMLHRSVGEAGSISGLRQMFRQLGGITMISVMTAVVSRSHNEGLALSHVYLILAIVVVVITVPLALTITDHRGSW